MLTHAELREGITALNNALDAEVLDLVVGDVTAEATGLSVYFPLNPAYYWPAYDDAASDLSWQNIFSWENIATEPLSADIPFDLSSQTLASGTGVTAAVTAADFTGNSDAVYFVGVL